MSAKKSNPQIVRPDSYKMCLAQAHSTAAACQSRGEPPPPTGLSDQPPEAHLRAALRLRQSILCDIAESAGMDPDIVACRGNVALAQVALGCHLQSQGSERSAEAVACYASALAILEEHLPTCSLTVELSVTLAGVQGGASAYGAAFARVEAYEAALQELLLGAADSASASSSGKGAELVASLQADLATAVGWHDGLLKNYGLELLQQQQPGSSSSGDAAAAYEAHLQRYRALLRGRGSPRQLALVHTLAGFLLARPGTGPTEADFTEAEGLYQSVLGQPGAAQHADFADASFNLGVILHLRAASKV